MHIPGNKEDVVYLFRASQEKIPDACASGIFGDPYGNLPRPEKCPPDTFPPGDAGVGLSIPTRFIQDKNPDACASGFFVLVTRTGIDEIREHPPSSRRVASAHRALASDGFDSHTIHSRQKPRCVCIGFFCLGDPYGNLPRPEKCPPDTFPPGDAGVGLSIPTRFIQDKNPDACASGFFVLVTRTGIEPMLPP